MSNNTALQIIDFDFYGDELIAVKDNATGEIYTSINNVLIGIGFNNKDQIRKRRDKWINDVVVSKGIVKFNIPTQKGVPKNDTPLSNEQDTYCISQHKLPLALAKINITPTMKRKQPELAAKLELYQDKCADVLASVFIEHKNVNSTNNDAHFEPFSKIIEAFTETLKGIQSDINEIKEEKNKALKANKYSRFKTRMFEKMNMLADYFNCTLREIMSNLFIEMENTYDIDIRDYSYECTLKTGVDNPLTLDVIDSNDKLKDCFEAVVDNEMSKVGLEYKNRIRPTIFNSTINEQDSKIVEMPS